MEKNTALQQQWKKYAAWRTQGFDKVAWDAVQDGEGITFTYNSKDGEEDFPATLK
jgi:hypothetical protein